MWGSLKKLITGAEENSSPDDEDVDIEDSFLSLYKKCCEDYGWTPREIDDTNLETLMDFLFYKSKPDPNTRMIEGKVYHRATKPPSWL